jgi:hypothetical protein
MAIPKPNVSKRRQRLWTLTFVLLMVVMLIWGWIFQAGRLLGGVFGVVIILFMGFYAEYLEYREQREREGPIGPSRAERRRALRQQRRRARGRPTRN